MIEHGLKCFVNLHFSLCHAIFFISFYATSSFGINKTREKIDRGTWFQTCMYTYSYIIPTARVRVTCIIYLSANNCISVSFLPPLFLNIENAGFCLISSSLHNFINTQMYTHQSHFNDFSKYCFNGCELFISTWKKCFVQFN